MGISDIIRRAIEIGEFNGWITFGELIQICLGAKVQPEDIEQILDVLSAAGVDLLDD
jgi:hypothetical protein